MATKRGLSKTILVPARTNWQTWAMQTDVEKLQNLVLSFHSLITIETPEEERAMSILRQVAEKTKLPLLEWTISKGLRDRSKVLAGPGDVGQLLSFLGEQTTDRIYVLKDITSHLNAPSLVRELKDVVISFSHRRSVIILLEPHLEVPASFEGIAAAHELDFPDRDELRTIVQTTLNEVFTSTQFKFEITPEQSSQFLDALLGLTAKQARQLMAYVIQKDRKLQINDLQDIVSRKSQILQADLHLKYYPPTGQPIELGGFENFKAWAERARLAYGPEAIAQKIPAPKGVMMVGVPGCGKSLAAKYLSQAWGWPLLRLDPGFIYDKFIGESEKNMRRALQAAETMSPAILWIDEIEKAFAMDSANDGGVTRRLFGSFLTWLQERDKPVFVFATANDLSHTPPELLRKGRFDEIFFVDLPGNSEREHILRFHLESRGHKWPAGSLTPVTSKTGGFSGAELEQLVLQSLMRCLQRKTPLTVEDLLQEATRTKPLSVSRAADIERLRERARENFVGV